MSGIFANGIRGSAPIGLTACLVMCLSHEVNNAETLPKVKRERMVEIARKMAAHKWICKPENRKADCSSNYRSRFKENETITGVA